MNCFVTAAIGFASVITAFLQGPIQAETLYFPSTSSLSMKVEQPKFVFHTSMPTSKLHTQKPVWRKLVYLGRKKGLPLKLKQTKMLSCFTVDTVWILWRAQIAVADGSW